MDAPVSQPSSLLLAGEGRTARAARLKKERKKERECFFGRVLDVSDGVIGSCGNGGKRRGGGKRFLGEVWNFQT